MDRPHSREDAETGKSERKPADIPVISEPAGKTAVVEAARDRPTLKAGPAGGAYIPPFRLLQVQVLVARTYHQHSAHFEQLQLLQAQR